MSQVATIEKIRAAVRALRNSLEAQGKDDQGYNVAMGISFQPAKGLNADQLIEAVTKNKTISANLQYGFQAGIIKEPSIGVTKNRALDVLNQFEEELSTLPQDASASMRLEFTVSNQHEKDIVDAAQKAINVIEKPKAEDVAKLAVVK